MNCKDDVSQHVERFEEWAFFKLHKMLYSGTHELPHFIRLKQHTSVTHTCGRVH